MLRRLVILAAVAAMFSAPGRTQDTQPSLGDLARQSRSQKGTTAPKAVITNDDLPSSSGDKLLALGNSSDPGSASKTDPESSAQASLTRLETVVKKIDSMDRAELLKAALQDANPNFPGHADWEDHLMSAKRSYVSQGLDLVDRCRRLLATAHALQADKATPDDPRVKELNNNLKDMIRDAVRTDAAFQAVIMEGRDLAHQSATH
jgi:hypothetical protein